MPFSVACPVCGADGTRAANEVIAFNLAIELSAHHGRRERMLLLAVFGCLVSGLVGVIKASTMANGIDVLFCLWDSVLAFGVAIYAYFWKTPHPSARTAKEARAGPATTHFITDQRKSPHPALMAQLPYDVLLRL